MQFLRRSPRCVAASLVALGLAVPTAQARLIDPPLGHTGATQAAQPRQDLRSPDSRDAATAGLDEQQVLASRGAGAPRPVVTSAPVTKVEPAGSGIDWASIGLGVAGFAAVLAAFTAANAAISRRGRVHAVR